MIRHYGRKTVIDGITFDSEQESKFYLVLKELKEKNEIKDFIAHHSMRLLPKYKDFNGQTHKESHYIADFVILNHDESVRIIDIKDWQDDAFKLKKALFDYLYRDACVMEVLVYSATLGKRKNKEDGMPENKLTMNYFISEKEYRAYKRDKTGYILKNKANKEIIASYEKERKKRERLIKRRAELLAKEKLTKTEKTRLDEIEKYLLK